MTRIFNSKGPPNAQGRSSLSRGLDEPGHRTGWVLRRGTPTGHRRGCHPRTGTNPVKRHRALQSNKKRGEGVRYFCPYWNAKWSLQDGRAEKGQNTVDQCNIR